ncbi:hypothetical protein VDG1235_4359 [Verrucomicrobiia bacterium DG1235]|nr:hypothetical protein VDG1235_4359 [Verrucomicrobiae bacterium DG1235]
MFKNSQEWILLQWSGASGAIRIYGILFALLGSVFLAGCSTGESAFRQGDYAEAARVSADRLSRQPKSEKAAEIFLNAYPQARAEWLERAKQAEGDMADPFRWERVFAAYEVLRDLSNRAALTPFAGSRGIVIDYHNEDLETARVNTVSARVAIGDGLVGTGDLYAAREAFGHYQVAMDFAGRREDLLQKLEVARRQGTLYVGVDPVVAQEHGINPDKLGSVLIMELERHPVSGFVSFLPSAELGDIVASRFLEMSIGELSIDRVEAEVGQREYHRVLSTELQDEDAEPREVRAKVFRREKKLVSSCPVQLRIFDGESGDVVFVREFDGRSVWSAQWDVLVGNKRAVAGEELHLSEPPDPELAELAQRLSESITAEARDMLAVYFDER